MFNLCNKTQRHTTFGILFYLITGEIIIILIDFNYNYFIIVTLSILSLPCFYLKSMFLSPVHSIIQVTESLSEVRAEEYKETMEASILGRKLEQSDWMHNDQW